MVISPPETSFLKLLRVQAKITQSELGQRIGVTKASVSAYEKGKAQPSREVIARLSQEFDLSIEALRLGIAKGETDGFSAAGPAAEPAVPQVPFLSVAQQVHFAASFGSRPGPGTEFVRVVGLPATAEFQQALVVEVEGDAMAPTLRAGARVLATPVAETEWNYMASGVYCVIYRSTFVIKRIKDNSLLEKKALLLHSDNLRDGAHPVRGEDIRAVWRVRWGVYVPIS